MMNASSYKYFKIYDKNHTLLEIFHNHSNLKYSWILNDFGSCEFDIGLGDPKCVAINFQHMNHLEIYDSTTNTIIWGGIIVGRDFQGDTLHINCFGYMGLLFKRRLRAKTYATQVYSSLFSAMLTDINSIYDSGVDAGTLSTNTPATTRKVKNTDYILSKFTEYADDINADFEVDNNRKLNFYTRKGSDKPYYVLQYGTDADNIIVAPKMSDDVMNMGNSSYGEITNGDTVVMSSSASDNTSKALYGLIEDVVDIDSSITLQTTVDSRVSSSLQCTNYPLKSFSITAIDSSMCPFSSISVGDAVTVKIPTYFNFSALMRIISMSHDEVSGQREFTFGQIVYKPARPQRRKYKN